MADKVKLITAQISIHAPLRERHCSLAPQLHLWHFNPRSLAGATGRVKVRDENNLISIHAPSRERRTTASGALIPTLFQSTLPRGSD